MKILGKDLKEGQKVAFTSSGRHYQFHGIVEKDSIKILPKDDVPEYLHGATWGLWLDHKYKLLTD